MLHIDSRNFLIVWSHLQSVLPCLGLPTAYHESFGILYYCSRQRCAAGSTLMECGSSVRVRKEGRRGGRWMDAGSVADLARRRTNQATTTGYALPWRRARKRKREKSKMRRTRAVNQAKEVRQVVVMMVRSELLLVDVVVVTVIAFVNSKINLGRKSMEQH